MKFNDLRETRKKKAVSRVLSRPKHRAAMIIHLGQPLPTASSDRTRRLQASNLSPHLDPPCFGESEKGMPPYLVLHRVGLCRIPESPTGIGALLPHRFTLAKEPRTLTSHTVSPWRFVFCGTFLRVTPTGCYPAPCSAEPGLSSPPPDDRGRSPGLLLPGKGRCPASRNHWHPAIECAGAGGSQRLAPPLSNMERAIRQRLPDHAPRHVRHARYNEDGLLGCGCGPRPKRAMALGGA